MPWNMHGRRCSERVVQFAEVEGRHAFAPEEHCIMTQQCPEGHAHIIKVVVGVSNAHSGKYCGTRFMLRGRGVLRGLAAASPQTRYLDWLEKISHRQAYKAVPNAPALLLETTVLLLKLRTLLDLVSTLNAVLAHPTPLSGDQSTFSFSNKNFLALCEPLANFRCAVELVVLARCHLPTLLVCVPLTTISHCVMNIIVAAVCFGLFRARCSSSNAHMHSVLSTLHGRAKRP
jgi:hypothetical protein